VTVYVDFTFCLPIFVRLKEMQRHKMNPTDRKQKYQSYLLRLWVEDINGKGVWRFSLENPFSGERRGFASLKDLYAYLEKETHTTREN
jgi:hypothetical protein